MKNYQKGFAVPLLIGIIAVLFIGGGVYVYESKKVEIPKVPTKEQVNETPVNTRTPTEKNSVTQTNSTTYANTLKPYITSISKSSGPIGTSIELKGYNLLANKGDQDIFIRNSKGEVATFGEGQPSHIDLSQKYVSMKFTLGEKACKLWVFGGTSCSSWMTIIPGEYNIYVGIVNDKISGITVVSNEVKFTVTTSVPVYTSINILSPNGGEMWKEGQVYQIKWSAKNIPGNQTIKLVDANNNVIRTLDSNINTINGGTGLYQYNWQIPQEFVSEASPGKFKILISSNDNTVSDYSDNQFTIFAGGR